MAESISNILIVGGGAVSGALARKFAQYSDAEEIYIASSSNIKSDFYKNIDIREDDLTSLLKFVIDNNISLTIPVSNSALSSDIVSFFESNGQNVFAPPKRACDLMLNELSCKKFLYKMRAQTSKFGIYNKPQMAYDFLKQANFPVIISSALPSGLLGDDKLIAATMSQAVRFTDELFINKSEQEIIIEEFSNGLSFTIYFITDGYTVLPLVSVANYKFFKDGEGFYADGVASYAPNYNISEVVISRITNIANNIIQYFDKNGIPYKGIIGIEGVLNGEDRFLVTGLKPFFRDFDVRNILNLLEEDLLILFNSCINASFSDIYSEIKTNNFSSASVVVYSDYAGEIIEGLERIEDRDNIDIMKAGCDNDKLTACKGGCFSLTRSAATLSKAKSDLYEDLAEISFKGIYYRKSV